MFEFWTTKELSFFLCMFEFRTTKGLGSQFFYQCLNSGLPRDLFSQFFYQCLNSGLSKDFVLLLEFRATNGLSFFLSFLVFIGFKPYASQLRNSKILDYHPLVVYRNV